MISTMQYVSKTQHYLRVKKPLLERQRRARINKCLNTLKIVIAELQGNDAILRMDKAEMLECTIEFMHSIYKDSAKGKSATTLQRIPANSYYNGYMNAVNEVSRIMAATPGMDVKLGKSVMTHLGLEFNRLLRNDVTSPSEESTQTSSLNNQSTNIRKVPMSPISPASSGYYSDSDLVPAHLPNCSKGLWRPW